MNPVVKLIIALLIALVSVPLSAQMADFNVNFDASGVPLVSGPGGGTPPPPGLPMVSNLSVNPPNGTHAASFFSPLWFDQYNNGDYFAFSVSGLNPEDRIVLDGAWFGTLSGPTGPTSFNIELWSDGSFLSGAATGFGPGVNLIFPTDIVSDSSVAEFRIVGLGGTDDLLPVNETFGLEFISFGFRVVPEPSSFLLSAFGFLAFCAMRRR